MKEESYLPKIKSGLITYWKNGKCGKFETNIQECLLYFREADPEPPITWKEGYGDYQWENNKRNNTIASGFIVSIINSNNAKATNIYENYYNTLRESYIHVESIKPGAYKRNLDKEFYSIHIQKEKEYLTSSQELFTYISDRDKELLQSFIEDYFEYIQLTFSGRIKKIGQPPPSYNFDKKKLQIYIDFVLRQK